MAHAEGVSSETSGSGDRRGWGGPRPSNRAREIDAAAGFDDGEDSGHSGLLAADVDPVFTGIEIFRYSQLCSLQNYVQSASPGCLSDHERPAFEREADVCRDTTEVADCP